MEQGARAPNPQTMNAGNAQRFNLEEGRNQPTQAVQSNGPVPPTGQPPKPAGVVGAIETGANTAYSDITKSFGSLFKSGVQAGIDVRQGAASVGIGQAPPKGATPEQESLGGIREPQAQEFAGSTAGYLLPGAAAIRGIGARNESPAARGFDIAVGVLPFIPIGEVAGAGSQAAKISGSLAGRAGIGAGFGAAGSLAYGNTNPVNVAESAAVGAGFGAGAGALGEAFSSKIGSSAAAGRLAVIKQEAPLTSEGPGPSFLQRISMGIQGGEVTARPVAGGGLIRAMEIGSQGQPIGAPPGARMTGQGLSTSLPERSQPPVSMTDFLQDIEGRSPTKNIPTGGEPRPSNTIVPVSPFTEEQRFGPSGPMKPFEPSERDIGFPPRSGPSGPGYGGGGGQRAVFEEPQQTRQLPPDTFDPTQRFREGLAERGIVSEFGFGNPSSRGAFATAVPQSLGIGQSPAQSQPPATRQQQAFQQQTPGQSTPSVSDVSFVQKNVVDTVQIDTKVVDVIDVTDIITVVKGGGSSSSTFGSGGSSGGGTFLQNYPEPSGLGFPFLLTPGADKGKSPFSSARYGFRKLKHPVAENLLALGFKGKRRKK